MKKLKRILLFFITALLSIQLFSCGDTPPKTPEVKIDVSENINLTSNEDIDWSQYISITVDEKVVNISEATITLLDGIPTETGSCSYKVTYTHDGQEYSKTFNVSYTYPPMEDEVKISVVDNINLYSDQNINWGQYISITVNNQNVNLSNATITLLSGTSTVTGTCTYKVSYTHDGQEYSKTFNVTFSYETYTLGDLQDFKLNQACDVKGIIVAKTSTGFLMKDLTEEEYVYAFADSLITIELFQIVQVVGKISELGGVKQITVTSVTDLATKNQVTFTPAKLTVEALEAYVAAPTVGVPVKIGGTLSISISSTSTSKNYNLAIENTTAAISLCNPTYNLESLDGKYIECEGYLVYATNYAFLVLTDEPIVKEEPILEIRDLTAEEAALFQAACNNDYSNVTLLEDMYGSAFIWDGSLCYTEYYDADENLQYLYLKYESNVWKYLDGEEWVNLPEEYINTYILSFNFKAIDISKVKYDPNEQWFVISAQDLSINDFFPYWNDGETTFIEFYFTMTDGYFDLVATKNQYNGETYTNSCLLGNHGSSEIPAPSVEATLGEIQNATVGDACSVKGIVVGITKKGILLKDFNLDEYVFVFAAKQLEFDLYEHVSVSGTVSEFGGIKQISSPTVTSLNNSTTVPFDPTIYTEQELAAYANNIQVGVAVTVTGTLNINNIYHDITVTGSSIVVSISYPTIDLSEYDGSTITVSGYLIYLSGSSTKYANLVLVSDETAGGVDIEDLTDLSTSQSEAWATAAAKNYTNATITESTKSSTILMTNEMYYTSNFDEYGYSSNDYFKMENGKLYHYTYTGWVATSTINPFLVFDFSMISDLGAKVKYSTSYGMYFISCEDLAVSSFASYWKSTTNAKYFGFSIDEKGNFSQIVLVSSKNNTLNFDYAFIYNVGTTEIIDPTISCTVLSVLEVQDYVIGQLCTVEGLVAEITSNGYVVVDEANRYAALYVTITGTPSIEVGHKIKIFGTTSACGTAAIFDGRNITIEDLGAVTSTEYIFNPEYFEVYDLEEYAEAAYSGAEVEFIATLQTGNKLSVNNLGSGYSIQILNPAVDLTSYMNKTVLVKGYLLYAEESGNKITMYMALKNIEISNGTNPNLKTLTPEQVTLFTEAMQKDYSNMTIFDSAYGVTSKFIGDTIVVLYTDNGTDKTYYLKKTDTEYLYSEDNSTWEAIAEQEYLASAIIFNFSIIDISKVKYNEQTEVYSISCSDLPVDDFLPFWSDDSTTFISYNIRIDEDGYFGAVQCVNIYNGGNMYLDNCILTYFGTTTL